MDLKNKIKKLTDGHLVQVYVDFVTLCMGKQQSSFDALGGEDMDLLLLLLFYVQPEHCEVLFATGTVKVCSQSLERKSSPGSNRTRCRHL